jgi:hypothetical protein
MTMDANPDHLDDETLSALLDGDAAEAGGRAHLTACDRCSARQAELGAARGALAAAPVEPLDELARRRLVAAAVRAADGAGAAAGADRTRWAQRHRAVIGSAAAVLLAVLVSVPFVVGGNGTTKQADTALPAQAPLAAPAGSAGPFLGDLGDLTDYDRLRLRLSGVAADTAAGSAAGGGVPAEPGPSQAAASASGAPPVPSAAPAGGGVAGSGAAARTAAPNGAASAPAGTTGSATGSGLSNSAAKAPAPQAGGPEPFSAAPGAAERDRADADACVAALLSGPARGGRLAGSGVGTWRGRPAVVAAFEVNGGAVAFLADRSGCAVLDRFAL